MRPPQPPVLGFLVDDLLSQYQVRLLMGLQRAAQKHGARLVSFPAGWFSESPPARFDGSFLFKLVRPPVVQGVIVEASILATEVGVDAVQRFCASLEVPTVSVSRLAGFPWVDSSASVGLQQAIEHLIFTHGCSRLCFIRGPQGNSHSQEREATFRQVLHSHGLPVREDWILPGDFLEGSGARAIATLLDERSISIGEIDAIVAANDLMAAGALEELTSRGVGVPHDVALVGFDDDDLARNADPPITTVAQLVERIGNQAVQLLLRMIRGEPVEPQNLVDVELIVRGSCGCGGRHLHVAADEAPLGPLGPLVRAQAGPCKHRLAVFFDDETGADGVDAAVRLVAGSDQESTRQDRCRLEQSIRATMTQGLEPLRWYDVIQPLDALLSRGANSPEAEAFAARFTGMKLHVSEVAAQIKASEVLRSAKNASALRVLGSVLVSSRSLGALRRILDAALPGLGVRLCCVCLFEGDPEKSLQVRVEALHRSEDSRATAPIQRTHELWATLSGANGLRSTTPPPQTLTDWPLEVTDAEPGSLVVFPLVFAEEPLGYVIFSAPTQPRSAWLLEGIAGHLSSAIHTMRNANRLRQASESAEAANTAKGEFVAMMSHEVRTPLTAVMGQLDLALGADLPSDVRGRLEMARTSSRALLSIVNDLLDFSKIEAGRLEMERIRFRLDEVLYHAVSATGVAAAKKGLELVVDVDPTIPDLVLGDPLHLSQVLVNLTSNAVKFSFSGEIILRVERAASDGMSTLRFVVQDSGIGMSEADRDRLFQPFTQGDSSTTRRYGGTGLGLAISQRLVTLLGGALNVESSLGEGTSFSFEIPDLASDSTAPFAPPDPRIHVLLVEDHPSQRQALLRTLTANNCATTVATTVREAHAALDEVGQDIQLMLIDSTLPDGEGRALAHTLASSHPQSQVVLMTPMDSAAHHHDGSLPITALPKPLVPSQTLELLAHARGCQTHPPPTALEHQVESRRDRLQDCRVLLVQDDAVSADACAELLRQLGALVVTATDGGRGVHEALSQHFDLVLMDLRLPVLDGYAAAQAIRMDPRYTKVPIIGLTAHQPTGTRRQCLAAGMNDCLTTPVRSEQLRSVLEAWLSRSDEGFSSGVFPTTPPPPERLLPDAAPLLDVASGVVRFGGNVAGYRRLLSRFIETHASTAGEVASALARHDHARALALVHTLVSAAGNVAATRLHGTAQTIEKKLQRGEHRVPDLLTRELGVVTELTLGEARSHVPDLTPQDCGASESRAHCRQLLREMDDLLAQHDTAALDRVDRVCSSLRSVVDGAAVRKLRELVRRYEFEQARAQLVIIQTYLCGE